MPSVQRVNDAFQDKDVVVLAVSIDSGGEKVVKSFIAKHGHTFVTLHVGLGTFQPIQVADYRRHPMHAEWGELPQANSTFMTTSCAGTLRMTHASRTSQPTLSSYVATV